MMRSLFRNTLVAALLLGLCAARANAQDRLTGRPFASRSEVLGRGGMAATSQPLATQIALDILKKGGTAVDAAIAANAALGLMEPTGCGLGGDLYAIVWDAKARQLHGLNASGRSPRSLTRAVFAQKGLKEIPALGPLPVSVPGAADGWFALHGRFGRLPMREVLAPAIRYAREGFPVSELTAYLWERNAQALKGYEGFAATFMPGGRTPRKGEVFKNPYLARTYEALARGGRDAFYKGDIARRIAAYMARNGGYLTQADLAAHTSEWVAPVATTYRGHALHELPPNGQGIAALQMLNILEGYDFSKIAFGSAEHIHLFVEAKKLAFEDRARYYADMAFARVPVEGLISKDYAAQRRALINPLRAARRYEAGTPALKEGGTIYLAVADGEGNMVSLIQSNFRGMGSGMTPDSLGFVLQDRGELFNLSDSLHANAYAPGKRPFHTIIPAFVTKDGAPWMAFGVMGGEFQPLGHVQILMNMVDFGMNAQEASDAPRIAHTGSSEPTGGPPMTDGGTVLLESGFAFETIRELMKRGHRVGYDLTGYGGYQAIRVDAATGVYYGASESRKDGQAAGY